MYTLTQLTKSTATFALIAILLAFAVTATAQPGRPPAAGTVTAVVPLTAAEAQSLTFMREEEKLARDVYQELYKKWNLTVFKNIAESEQTHFDAVGTLLTRYGVPDPAQNTAPGVYTNPTFISLYNDLIAKGMLSAQDALEAGALIETRDIADLQTALSATAKLDLKRVYTNLLNASFNHLEAFQTMCELVTPAGL
ncbi:MAG: DUF2202 domain-containing protein [Acidobacteria bacterium]|nr:DUF2202 domain-containing protein [Acidobacteriota bacterium]